jgi:hypothetical protein
MNYQKFSHKTPHLKGKQHQLDPNLDTKQLVKHATVQYVDWDNDGDVDEYDKKPKLVPDENPTAKFASDSKKLIAKQKGEVKHTKRGMAYEDLRKWFGKGGEGGVGGGGWDEYNTKGERTGKCARGEDDDGEGPKPKCLSKEKAAKMTKQEIAAAVKRKREEDPVADRSGKGGKPKMVSNKIGEEKEESRYCMMCKKQETRNECSYGPEMWDKMTYKYFLESKKSQPDHEHSMARSELATIEKAVKRLKTKMKGEGNIEAWVQSKITKAADYIDAAADYLDSGEHNVQGSMDEACWKGYKQVGMKKKGKKQVPNCVPVSEASFEITHTSKDVRKAKKLKKIDALAQRGTGGEQTTAARMAGVSLPSIRKEDISVVDKILLEMEAEILTEKNKPTNPKLWAKWKSKAKAKFDVYPSAYANGWAAKGYKSEGGGWESVSEDITIEDANGNTFAEITDVISIPRNTNEDEVCAYCGCDPCECEGNGLDEAVRIPAKSGNLLMVIVMWKGKTYGLRVFFPQSKIPNKKEVEQEIQKIYPECRVTYFQKVDREPGQPFLQLEGSAWTKKEGKSKSGGLNEKGRRSYEAENPGSDLKAPSKKVGNPRRKSFCARMTGMKKKLTSSKTANDPNSRINKSLRAWNC